MKKLFLFSVLFLASCGIKYTPSVNMTPTNTINFATDIKKEERKCAYGPFWLPPFSGSDISVVTIARNARFKKVLLTDNQADFFILFNRTCTVVYGE
ncbi:MAG: TRL-like protein family [Rickettsiaceae bacterium]|jgi:hypothetical protein|nr:TRL-like protein family [Rickettsiaceae bacterium]